VVNPTHQWQVNSLRNLVSTQTLKYNKGEINGNYN
jgi:hypothetical protein